MIDSIILLGQSWSILPILLGVIRTRYFTYYVQALFKYVVPEGMDGYRTSAQQIRSSTGVGTPRKKTTQRKLKFETTHFREMCRRGFRLDGEG